MADISKIKLPNNSSYDVKDKHAGRSVALNLRDLLLKNAAGTTISSVELPLEKTKLVYGQTGYSFGSFTTTVSGRQDACFAPTIVYIINELTNKVVGKLLFINKGSSGVSNIPTFKFTDSLNANSIGNIKCNIGAISNKGVVILKDPFEGREFGSQVLYYKANPIVQAAQQDQMSVVVFPKYGQYCTVINASSQALITNTQVNNTATVALDGYMSIDDILEDYYFTDLKNVGAPLPTGTPGNLEFTVNGLDFSSIVAASGKLFYVNYNELDFTPTLANISVTSLGTTKKKITVTGLTGYYDGSGSSPVHGQGTFPIKLTLTTNNGDIIVTNYMLPDGCMY